MATSISGTESNAGIRSSIPARIDRLSWAPFHTRMVLALGVAWVLDGLEITIASGVGAVLTEQATLGLSARPRSGLIATVYLLGEVVRRAALRPAVGRARPQEPVHHHPRRLPRRQRRSPR